jgi:cold shock CspA family protein
MVQLIDENNLALKKVPDGPDSLFKALSSCIYFTTVHHGEIRQALHRHLTSLISLKKLPPKLAMFQGNNVVWKDYSSNPLLAGFDKINLELASNLFQVRVVVYYLTDDNYLNATIINNKHQTEIQLIRSRNNHYDPVFKKSTITSAGFCQNIVLNLIERAMNPQAVTRNYNNDNFYNFEFEAWRASRDASAEIPPVKGHHKKSLSDGEKALEGMGDPHMKVYNMFVNPKPPEDFVKKILRNRKDTADELFESIANLDFNDNTHDSRHDEYAVKNYPVNRDGSSKELLEDGPFTHTGPKTGGIFFSESMTLSEIEESSQQQKGELYFANTPPPGLTPTRYPQKSYAYTDMNQQQQQQVQNEYTSPSPSMMRGDNGQMNQGAFMYGGQDMQMQYQQYYQQSPGNLYAKRAGSGRVLTLSATSDEFKYGNDAQMYQMQKMQMQGSMTKQKPIILEESMQRYSGRLKFFDENKNYGFIIMDDDGSDIFVHYDDLAKAGINKELLKTARMGNVIKLSFSCMKYVGKYDKSRKATDIQVLV